MNLSDLDPEEQVVLLGLVHYMVQADGDRSEDEMLEFRELAQELGRKDFDIALREALRRFADTDAVLAAAADITRIEAKQIMHTVVHDLAAVDGIIRDEAVLLKRLTTLWGLAP